MPDISGARSPLMFIPPQLSIDTDTNTNFSPSPVERQTPNGLRYQESAVLDLHLDKLRIVDALTARDIAVYRLQSACASIRAKELAIERLEKEKDELKMDVGAMESVGRKESCSAKEGGKRDADVFSEQRQKLQDKIGLLEAANKALKSELEMWKVKQESLSVLNTPRFNEMAEQGLKGFPFVEDDSDLLSEAKSPVPCNSAPISPVVQSEIMKPEAKMEARYAILSNLPIPSNLPTDTLIPIVVPPPFSIHDFLGTVQGELKAQLSNYRVFQECTTSWCPDREEHGYFLTSAFKCITNPRVSTAHRWVSVDLAAKCNKPMECFYNKENKWYYAGLYKAFKLDDLSTEEWSKLSTEATQTLIKETLSARKNTSPQNIYEASQLYLAGALKVACIGLQCVGFSEGLYRALLDQAEVCGRSGRWRGPVASPQGVIPGSNSVGVAGGGGNVVGGTGTVGVVGGGAAGGGLGTAGAAWNVTANLVATGVAGMLKVQPCSGFGENGSEKEDVGKGM